MKVRKTADAHGWVDRLEIPEARVDIYIDKAYEVLGGLMKKAMVAKTFDVMMLNGDPMYAGYNDIFVGKEGKEGVGCNCFTDLYWTIRNLVSAQGDTLKGIELTNDSTDALYLNVYTAGKGRSYSIVKCDSSVVSIVDTDSEGFLSRYSLTSDDISSLVDLILDCLDYQNEYNFRVHSVYIAGVSGDEGKFYMGYCQAVRENCVCIPFGSINEVRMAVYVEDNGE